MKTKYLWAAVIEQWKMYGIWHRNRVFIGVSIVADGEVWEDR